MLALKPLIEHSPDIYLDKIQDQLYEQHNIDISLPTIWETLKRLGITSKKVLIRTSSSFKQNLPCCSYLRRQQSSAKRHSAIFHSRLEQM
jgi:hypothetical protein